MLSKSYIKCSLDKWDVSNVTNMSYMFYDTVFNNPLNSWNVSKVTNMSGMFKHSYFLQPIDNWDVSNVTDMNNMFANSYFNQPLNTWNVSKVTDMSNMFKNAQYFNQPLNNWNISNVRNMSHMFDNARSFNQRLTNWNNRHIIFMEDVFINTQMAPENYPRANSIVTQNREIACQVHRASSRIDYQKLNSLLSSEIPSNQTRWWNWRNWGRTNSRRHYTTLTQSNLKPWMTSVIDTSIDDQADVIDLKRKLNRMTQRLLHIPEQFMSIIKSVINYVNVQSKEFKRNYIHDLINQSVSAYYGDENSDATMSCVQGIAERFVFALKAGCVENIDTDMKCRRIVRTIDGLDDNTYTITSTVPTNDLQNETSKCVNDEANKTALLKLNTLDERKDYVEQCLINKFVQMSLLLDETETNINNGKRLVTNQVREYVNSFAEMLSTDMLSGGGKRKTRKTRKIRNTRTARKKVRNVKKTRNVRNTRKHRKTKKTN